MRIGWTDADVLRLMQSCRAPAPGGWWGVEDVAYEVRTYLAGVYAPGPSPEVLWSDVEESLRRLAVPGFVAVHPQYRVVWRLCEGESPSVPEGHESTKRGPEDRGRSQGKDAPGDVDGDDVSQMRPGVVEQRVALEEQRRDRRAHLMRDRRARVGMERGSSLLWGHMGRRQDLILTYEDVRCLEAGAVREAFFDADGWLLVGPAFMRSLCPVYNGRCFELLVVPMHRAGER